MNGRLTGHGSLSGDLTGGIGGVSDYDELENLPKMNGKTIEGEHDGHYYGLANLSDIPEPYTPPSYSTNEVNTGVKWIDGKDVYRKTFNVTLNSTSYYIDVTNLHIDNMIKIEGALKGTNSYALSFPYCDASSWFSIPQYNINDKRLEIMSSSNMLANYIYLTFTIEYTEVTE